MRRTIAEAPTWRNANGTWTPGFNPTSGTDFVQADSWIYTGMVPFGLAGLASAKGGDGSPGIFFIIEFSN